MDYRRLSRRLYLVGGEEMQLSIIFTVFYALLQDGVRCIPLAEFYPFGATVNETLLLPNDDGSSSRITLSSVFPFFDENYETVYVSTNGALSFTNPISQYTPEAFPTNATKEIIAPYWADVDTTGTGDISYRETTGTDLLQRANNDIRRAFPTITFSSKYLFIATWDHVGFFDSQVNKTNTFQAVLATDGLLSFVIFLYADGEIQWTTGDASDGINGLGGIPAQVGFDAGDGIRHATVPGSRTDAIINITQTSNVGIPGVWIFRIDGQEVVVAGCQIVTSESDLIPLSLFPRYGNVLGGTTVQVFGPCFDRFVDHTITCSFNEIEVQAIFVDSNSIICISPGLTSLGRINFVLTIDGIDAAEFQETTFYTLGIDEASMVNSNNEDEDDLLFISNDMIEISWDKDSLLPPLIAEEFDVTVTLDIQLFELDESGNTQFVMTLASDVSNTGQYSVMIPSMNVESTAVFKVTIAKVISALEAIPEYVKTIFNQIKGKVAQWSDAVYVHGSNYLRDKCDEWCRNQREGIGEEILGRLPACPPTEGQARRDRVFKEEDLGDDFREFYHPNTSSCFRQDLFTECNQGSGQQCCYDKVGDIVVGPPGGGTVDLYAPTGFFGKLNHFYHDVRPFFYCCKGEFPNCDAYYKKRPSDDGSRYNLRPPACVYGDPHMVTLDGYKYTFNGKGEFTLVEHVDRMFTLQARMVEAENSNGLPVRATVFSAVVAKHHNSDIVEFKRSRRGLDALVNGVMVDFENLPKQEFNNVTLSDLGNQTLLALFSSGAYVEAKLENGIISVLLVSLPDSFYNATYGLMGVFNNDMTDDLMIRNSSQYLPLNASNEDIHWEFGLSWVVNETESLFTYPLRESWLTYHDPSFVPSFTPVFPNSSFEAETIEACNNDTFCIYDIATTGRMDIGLSTLDGSRNFDEIVQLSYPIICEPPCEQGACVANDTCNCAEGYIGERCTEPVYSDCEVGICTNGGTCRKLGSSYICSCPNGYVGSDCEIEVNECLINNGGCNHICTNTPGSFECSCDTSYILAPADNKTCFPKTTDCFNIIMEPNGHINTTGFPDSLYAPNTTCTWIIWLPTYGGIELEFDEIDIEDSLDCVKDRMTIWNGKEGESLSSSYCGNQTPAIFKSSTEIVTINFVSDDTVNNKGFSLQYKGLTEQNKAVYDCNLVFSTTTTFGLPTFPSKYYDEIDCVYYFVPIRYSGRQRVKLTFLYLDIVNADCSTDKIEIYDGITRSATRRDICNGNVIEEYISNKGNVKMTYTGKSVGKYRGFLAVVRFL